MLIEMRFRNRGGDLESYFSPSEIKKRIDVPKVLVVRISGEPARLKRLQAIEEHLWSYRIERIYTLEELSNAELFRLKLDPRAVSSQGGEEYGTHYDMSASCQLCGAGRVQKTNLILDLHKLPKRFGLAGTLSGDLVLAEEIAEQLDAQGLTGFNLLPVKHRSSRFAGPVSLSAVDSGQELLARAAVAGLATSGPQFTQWLNQPENMPLFQKAMAESADRAVRQASHRPIPRWFQIVPVGRPVSLSPRTESGCNPLDPDPTGKCWCRTGHTVGWDLLSEAFIERSSWDGHDLVATSQLYGHHPEGSLFYPTPVVLMSPRMRYQLVQVRGAVAERAHLA